MRSLTYPTLFYQENSSHTLNINTPYINPLYALTYTVLVVSGKIPALPWCEVPLQPETSLVRKPITTLNLNGFLTINSQPGHYPYYRFPRPTIATFPTIPVLPILISIVTLPNLPNLA